MERKGQINIEIRHSPFSKSSYLALDFWKFIKFWFWELCSKELKEVALRIIEIFTFIGAPNILQKDNGREFVVN